MSSSHTDWLLMRIAVALEESNALAKAAYERDRKDNAEFLTSLNEQLERNIAQNKEAIEQAEARFELHSKNVRDYWEQYFAARGEHIRETKVN